MEPSGLIKVLKIGIVCLEFPRAGTGDVYIASEWLGALWRKSRFGWRLNMGRPLTWTDVDRVAIKH